MKQHNIPDIIYGYLQANAGGAGIPDFLFAIASYLIPCIVILGVLVTVSGLLTYGERKVSADIQNRVGCNRVGPFGLLQMLADG